MNVLNFIFCHQEIRMIPSRVYLRRVGTSVQGLIFPQKQNKPKPKTTVYFDIMKNNMFSFQLDFDLALCRNNDPRIIEGEAFDSSLDLVYSLPY